MSRSRLIKPDFWDDQKLGTVSRDARLTFIGLWTNSDDYGVVKGHGSWLKNRIFPYDDIKKETFDKWLNELERIKVIIPFDHNGETFYFIKHFNDHQKVSHPSPSRNPEPPEGILSFPENSGKFPESFENESGSFPEQFNLNRNTNELEENYILDSGKGRNQERYLFDKWNSLEIIKHREFEKYKPFLTAKLKNFTLAEIEESMVNYKTVLNDPNSWLSFKWPLNDFLTRKNAFDSFLTVNNPLQNYKKNSKSPDRGKSAEEQKQEILRDL